MKEIPFQRDKEGKPYLDELFTPKSLFSRQDRRQAVFEYEKLFEILAEIEANFRESLFKPDDLVDNVYYSFHYDWFYQQHLEAFIRNCDWIEKNIKPKYWAINRNYFEQQYKPLENHGRII